MEHLRRQLRGGSLAQRPRWLVLPALLLASAASQAGKADVLKVDVACDADRICKFDVTVKHADAGWSHYANKWEIVTSDGVVLGTRMLAHPHDHEQPFMRSLEGVEIPDDIETVIVRASDSVHGLGGKEITVTLPPGKR